jgi:uncharacterized membrane protein (UPF0127 family)
LNLQQLRCFRATVDDGLNRSEAAAGSDPHPPARSLARATLFVKRLAFALALGATTPGATAADALPTVALSINGHKISAEVAATPDRRATGLMHRFRLRPDHGMVFVSERAEPQAFWMKNTYIPLSIAFIAPNGRIINIADMAPEDENLHWSKGPALYALEMRKGWFAERGIQDGDAVKGLPEPKR